MIRFDRSSSAFPLTAFLPLFLSAVVSAQPPLGDSLAVREENALKSAAAQVEDSVVQIRTIGGLDRIEDTLLSDGPTTGLVVSSDGFIVSSAFNFVQQPASILITFQSGKQAPAELLATDHSRMLVLLKVDAVDLPVPKFAPRSEIRVGQWAIAVGKTYRADRANVSIGIVSALNRMHGKVLQTDAAVSTANYGGPLIDMHGRVLGIIVPMAPQGSSEVAGVEWYDSGIGFAAPFSAIADRLEFMKRGEDQYSGLLGIGMGTGNPHILPAKLTAVRPDSPAGMAGLRKEDRVVEIDGREIQTQTDLRFALGQRYGGESVRVVVERGNERIERTITLASELAPFRHAFLGILPMRSSASSSTEEDPRQEEKPADNVGPDSSSAESQEQQAAAGVPVRSVIEGSPADESGVVDGDLITHINETEITTIDDAVQEMNNHAPGTTIEIRLRRGEQILDLALAAGRLPTSIIAELPAAYAASTNEGLAPREELAPGKSTSIKLPEFPQSCDVYVPPSDSSERSMGVIVWLQAPGEAEPQAIIRRLSPICDRDGLLLLIPSAANPERWERTELEFLSKVVAHALNQYSVDSRRTVVFGQGGGGAMAYLLALSDREHFRGVATASAPLPRQLKVPPNEQSQRFAVFAGLPTQDRSTTALVVEGMKKFADAGYPVTTTAITDDSGQLSDDELEQLARWIDSLDRF